VSVTVDTSMIPGYTTSMPITMEFQAVGTTLACCIQGFPADKVLVTTDATYATGAVGLKTYEMSAVYDNFAVFD